MQTVTFRLGHSLLKTTHGLGVVLGMAALAVPFLAYFILRIAAESGVTLTGFAQALTEQLGDDLGLPEAGVTLLALAALGIWLETWRRARLRVDADGVSGYLPGWSGLRLLGWTVGSFHAPWREMDDARLELPGRARGAADHLRRARLVITVGERRLVLMPFQWVSRAGHDHRLTLGQAARPFSLDAVPVLRDAPLVRALEDAGVPVAAEEVGTRSRANGYDLSRHRGLMLQVATVLTAGGYALVDGLFIGPYRLLGSTPWAIILVTAVVSAALAYQTGRGAPLLERLGVGVMAVAAVTAAVYPALLRFNAFAGEPVEVRYLAFAPGRFESAKEDWPALDLRDLDIDAYWAQYPGGSEHTFVMIRGVSGASQVDLRPLFEQTRDFYRKRRQAER